MRYQLSFVTQNKSSLKRRVLTKSRALQLNHRTQPRRIGCSSAQCLGTAEANALYESFKAGTIPPLSAPVAGVRKSFSEGNIKLFARATSIEMARGDLPTLVEEGTNGDSRQVIYRVREAKFVSLVEDVLFAVCGVYVHI
jgi:hypothetical protein